MGRCAVSCDGVIEREYGETKAKRGGVGDIRDTQEPQMISYLLNRLYGLTPKKPSPPFFGSSSSTNSGVTFFSANTA
jgi:hypothetical protein